MEYRKVYVEVVASFREDGLLLPRELLWEDGRRYRVDKVSDEDYYMARKNRTPEENARREKIRELLQMANIGSMDDPESV